MKIQDLNEVEDEIDYSRKLAPVARKLFQQAYPGVKISTSMTGDGFLEIHTSDEKFRFSIAISHQFGDNIISVGDAYSGEYRGIVSKLIKAGVDLLKKLHPEAEITLIPQHDVSDGVWQYIANKLGIGYENNSWY